jgi:hypothetical protein
MKKTFLLYAFAFALVVVGAFAFSRLYQAHAALSGCTNSGGDLTCTMTGVTSGSVNGCMYTSGGSFIDNTQFSVTPFPDGVGTVSHFLTSESGTGNFEISLNDSSWPCYLHSYDVNIADASAIGYIKFSAVGGTVVAITDFGPSAATPTPAPIVNTDNDAIIFN